MEVGPPENDAPEASAGEGAAIARDATTDDGDEGARKKPRLSSGSDKVGLPNLIPY